MVFAVDVGDSLQQGFDQFFAFLPNLLAFLAILAIGIGLLVVRRRRSSEPPPRS